jgi:uncharacterized membrane protein YhaH (DUF805 family)
MLKKIFMKIVSDKLVRMVFDPGGKITSPQFLTLFLLQCTCIWAVSFIIHSQIVVLPLALYLFIKLFRARLSSVRGGKGLAIAAAVIAALYLTEILLIDRTFIYYIPPQLLFGHLSIYVPPMMRMLIFFMPIVLLMTALMSLVFVVIVSIFPRGKNEWRDWARNNVLPLFSFSGKMGRISFLYVTFVIKLLLAVSFVIMLVLIYFVSRGDFRDLFMYNQIVGIILLIILASLFIAAFIALLGALMRRLRDLGRSVPALLLYIAGLILIVLFNPFSMIVSDRFIYYIFGANFGIALAKYIAPVIANLGSAVRVLWACMVFYIALYSGSEKDRL